MRFSYRVGISPIISTVLVVAVTLVAAVAIGGFVFGLFGAQSSTAQVVGTSVTLSSTITSGATASVSCASSAPVSNFIVLRNQGEAATAVVLVVIQFSGVTDTYSPTGTCSIAGGGTLYLSIAQLGGATPTKGAQFAGYAALNNGAQVLFDGAFT